MSPFVFQPRALAEPVPRRRRAWRVEPVPEGIRWLRPDALLPSGAAAPLLEALLEAWGGVAEALAFRHERISNLSYAPTSTDADALHRLARAIALAPLPPLAASTWLMITVQSVAGKQECEVPLGLAVQSVPAGTDRPQLFETERALRAHVAWNAVSLQLPPVLPPRLETSASSALLGAAGLSVGRQLALLGTLDGRPWAVAVTLTEAEIARSAAVPARAAPRVRRISWGAPLGAGPSRPIEDARAIELASPTGLFGADAAAWQSAPDVVRYQLSEPRGGLLRFSVSAPGAAPQPQALPAFARAGGEPRALAARGDVWIAASSAGVFRSLDAGVSWARTGQRSWVVTATCWSDAGLFLGTASHGVLRSADAGESWEVLRGGTVVTQGGAGLTIALGRLPRCSVRALGAFPTGPDDALLLAGTNAGPYYQQLGDPAWYFHSAGLPLRGVRTGSGGPVISALALEPGTGALLLGSDHGLFRTLNLDQPWQLIDPSAVSSLSVEATGGVWVGFEGGGLYRWDQHSLTPVAGVDSALVVRALCVTSAGSWLGCEDGCYWSGDSQHWLRISTGPVAALAALPEGGVLAASRLDGPVDTEWPGFALSADRLDLDGVQPRVLLGPALVVDDSSGSAQFVNVKSAAEVELQGFGQRRRVTRLVLEPDPHSSLPRFSRRTTRVWLGARALGSLLPDAPAPATPPAQRTVEHSQLIGSELLVDARIPDPTGRDVFVSGPLLRTRLAKGSKIVETTSGVERELAGDALATLQELPSVRDGQTWARVRTEDGLEGSVHAPELPLLAGDEHSSPTVLLRRVLAFRREGTLARLTLDTALGLPLDPGATRLHANVVRATHGARVPCEVLGSGDPNQSRQRFQLLQPLCWVLDESGEAIPQLELRVSDRLWQRVDSLADVAADERAYALECDLNGAAWICLGDGRYGARPPAGMENITACYRAGGGSAGNLPANAIRVLRSRPPGVKAARNLLPASGGGDVEALGDLRARIPLHARLPEHIVSVPDFLDHLRTLSGIAKVAVRQLWNGHAHVVHLTVATTDAGAAWAIDPSSRLAVSLRSLSERSAVIIDSVDVAWFSATLDVAVEPDLESAPTLAAVCAALRSGYGFGARAIGDGVVPSALVALAMSVKGVSNAVLRSLHASSEPAPPEVAALPGIHARFDARAGVVRPGRLWLLGPHAAPAALTPAAPEAPVTSGLLVRVLEAP